MLPTPRDKAIILAVYTHGRLSREQVRRLFFRKQGTGVHRGGEGKTSEKSGDVGVGLASIQAAGARLRRLAHAGYLTRIPAPVLKGSSQYLYSLGPVGAKLLNAEYKITAGVPGARSITSGLLGLNHTLEVADFYIALKEGLEQAGGTVLTWLGERDAAFRFQHQGRRRMIAPDAYALWSVWGRNGSFFLEWERGHQTLEVLGAKLDGYDAYYARRGYLEHLGAVGLMPRLVFVLPDVRRGKQFLGWIERQLARARWRFLPTVLVGARPLILMDVLGKVWNRPGSVGTGWLTSE